jgi:hypothetical protein
MVQCHNILRATRMLLRQVSTPFRTDSGAISSRYDRKGLADMCSSFTALRGPLQHELLQVRLSAVPVFLAGIESYQLPAHRPQCQLGARGSWYAVRPGRLLEGFTNISRSSEEATRMHPGWCDPSPKGRRRQRGRQGL